MVALIAIPPPIRNQGFCDHRGPPTVRNCSPIRMKRRPFNKKVSISHDPAACRRVRGGLILGSFQPRYKPLLTTPPPPETTTAPPPRCSPQHPSTTNVMYRT